MKANIPWSSSGSSDIPTALAELGARYDAAPNFPADSLRLLRAGGYHRRFAPEICGGTTFLNEEERCVDMAHALRIVGQGHLSIGRLYEGHVNALLLFEWYGSPAQLGWLNEALDRGAWFGVWATEPTPGVRLHSGDRLTLSGEKTFASGAGGLDFAIVTTAVPESDRRMVIVRADDPERADMSEWRVRGMRASLSGRYTLDEITVSAKMLLGGPGDYDREPHFTAGAWRFCAVQLGGIEALMMEMRRSMRCVARENPVQRARFADAAIAARSARLWVEQAARHFAKAGEHSVAVARLTRSVLEQAGFLVMEVASRILGTRSAFDGERADKIIRDLSLYLRQAGPDYARDEAAKVLLDHDIWDEEDSAC